MCEYPGLCLNIDEMLKFFRGQSHQRVQMRCKPIKEGLKFCAICDSTTGFVYHFIPDGLKDKDKGTVVDCVMWMVKTLPDTKIESNRGTKGHILLLYTVILHMAQTLVRYREESAGVFGTARAT